MSAYHVNVADVKAYLPSTFNYTNKLKPQIPCLSYSTEKIFYEKSNRNLDAALDMRWSIYNLKTAVQNLKKAEKSATLHKVLSLLALAASVTLIASAVFLCPPVLPFLALAGISYGLTSLFLEKLRTNSTKLLFSGLVKHIFLTYTMGAFSLGLAAPIHYVVSAFGRCRYLEKQVQVQRSFVIKAAELFSQFLHKHGDQLQKNIESELVDLKKDLPILEQCSTYNACKKADSDCKSLIKDREQALEELAAVRAFFSS